MTEFGFKVYFQVFNCINAFNTVTVYSEFGLQIQRYWDIQRNITKAVISEFDTGNLVGLRGSAVERQSLASVLSPSGARPVADG